MSDRENPPKKPPPGTSPATNPEPTTKSAGSRGGAVGEGAAILRTEGRQDASSSPARGQDKAYKDKGKAVFEWDSRSRSNGAAGPGFDFARPSSYRDAVVRPRTFKPRFPASSSQDHQQWYTRDSMGGRKEAQTVWSRLGSAHDGTGGKAAGGSNGGSWLATSKAKAGKRCYNCLSSGHLIAACRDPPRCLRRYRFGHMAARCEYLEVLSHSRAAAAAFRSAAFASCVAAASRSAAVAPCSAAAEPESRVTDPSGAVSRYTASRAAAAGAAPAAAMEEEFLMYNRVREDRRGHVAAGVRRTAAIRGEERALEIIALLAVQVDAGVRLDSARIRAEAAHQLQVPVGDLGVSRVSPACFLLRFDGQHQRNSAYRLGKLTIGHVRLQLLPWKRQVGARAELFKFFYHVRLCIEGVPVHARQLEVVASLLPRQSFVDDLVCDLEKAEEEECYRLWIWTSDPAAIATTGTLHIQEPFPPPAEMYADSMEEPGMPTFRSPRRSYDSPISGIPDEELEESWPGSHPFPWSLGVPDGVSRQSPAPRRISVHDRLGGRGRDRSPPRGGGSSGLGLRQVPPSGPHDVGAMLRGQGGNYFHGGSSRHGGAYYQRRGPQGIHGVWRWLVKGQHDKLKEGCSVQSQQSTEPGDSFRLHENPAFVSWATDPMLDEAGLGKAGPARQQRSVEPTAVHQGLAFPEPVLEQDTGVGPAEQRAGVPCHSHDRLANPEGDGDLLHCVDAQREMTGDTTPHHVGSEPGNERAGLLASEQQGEEGLNVEDFSSSVAQDGLGKQHVNNSGSVVPRVSVTASLGEEVVVPATDDDPTPVDGPGITEGADQQEDQLEEAASRQVGDAAGLVAAEEGGLVTGVIPRPNRGLLIDLNEVCGDGPDSGSIMGPECGGPAQVLDQGAKAREVLGEADRRLNCDERNHPAHRPQPRGIARFAVPLKKSLLCNPMPRSRGGNNKKGAAHDDKRIGKAVKKAASAQPPEEKATTLLMRTMGVLSDEELPSTEAQEKFGLEFVAPVLNSLMGNMRNVLGMSTQGGRGVLDELIVEADD
ncbi:unnamed protein product [Urochloa humidicola]